MSNKIYLGDIINSNKTVINCKTQEEAVKLTRSLHRLGRRWASGESYIDNTYWDSFGKETCYNVKDNSRFDSGYYYSHGYEVLFIEQVLFDEDINKTNNDNFNQKRYEIAKSVLPNLINGDYKNNCKSAIMYADTLLEELGYKNPNTNNHV